MLGRVVDALGRPIDGLGPIAADGDAPGGDRGPRHHRPAAGEGAAADGHQGHRLDDPDRPRPARADHRRPRHRQDGDRDRHDHQPEGHRASSASTSPSARSARRSPRWSSGSRTPARWTTRSSSWPRRRDPAPLQYIAPYAGCAMAEYFMYDEGKATLCVYDDLSKQAAAYRQLSLVLRRPPGREAYPGDVFYLHSRLLERAAKIAEDPAIVEARPAHQEAGRLAHGAADHRDAGRRRLGLHPDQRHLDHRRADLPRDRPVLRQRPPCGQRRHLGVSRVGGNAQIKAMKQVAGRLRLDLAQYRELEAFAAVRLRPRRGHPAPAGARRAHGRGAQAAAVHADAGGAAGR